MEYDFAVNEQISVQTEYVGRERQPVLVVENYLLSTLCVKVRTV